MCYNPRRHYAGQPTYKCSRCNFESVSYNTYIDHKCKKYNCLLENPRVIQRLKDCQVSVKFIQTVKHIHCLDKLHTIRVDWERHIIDIETDNL